MAKFSSNLNNYIADHRPRVENRADIIEGAKYILRSLGIHHCGVGIENNKPDAIEEMTKAAEPGGGGGKSLRVHSPFVVTWLL